MGWRCIQSATDGITTVAMRIFLRLGRVDDLCLPKPDRQPFVFMVPHGETVHSSPRSRCQLDPFFILEGLGVCETTNTLILQREFTLIDSVASDDACDARDKPRDSSVGDT